MSDADLRFGAVLPPARVNELLHVFVRRRDAEPDAVVDAESKLTAAEVASLVESVIAIRALDEGCEHPDFALQRD